MRFRSTHKKDLLAKLFCEKGEKRGMRTSAVRCARALNEGFCIISAKSVPAGGAFPWRRQDSRRFRQGVWRSQIPAKGALLRRRIPSYVVLQARKLDKLILNPATIAGFSFTQKRRRQLPDAFREQ